MQKLLNQEDNKKWEILTQITEKPFIIICCYHWPGADPGEVGLGAPDAPADDAGQEPPVILLAMDHQGASGVTLRCE